MPAAKLFKEVQTSSSRVCFGTTIPAWLHHPEFGGHLSSRFLDLFDPLFSTASTLASHKCLERGFLIVAEDPTMNTYAITTNGPRQRQGLRQPGGRDGRQFPAILRDQTHFGPTPDVRLHPALQRSGTQESNDREGSNPFPAASKPALHLAGTPESNHREGSNPFSIAAT